MAHHRLIKVMLVVDDFLELKKDPKFLGQPIFKRHLSKFKKEQHFIK